MAKKETSKKTIQIIVLVVILFLVVQLGIVYYINEKNKETLTELKATEQRINQILLENENLTQSQINSLVESVGSVSILQENLKKEVSEIKATTSSDFSGIIENAIQGVVSIKTDVAQGSGFFITNDGYVVTNAHVLYDARYATVYTYNGGAYAAELMGYDINLDVALLKIKANNWKELSFADSDDLKLGEKVLAIGNPLGYSFTATEGIISALKREGSNNLPYYIQTDVSLNPGNSGGPLIDTSGKVIGINNFKIQSAEGIGFALESDQVTKVVNEISEKTLNMSLV